VLTPPKTGVPVRVRARRTMFSRSPLASRLWFSYTNRHRFIALLQYGSALQDLAEPPPPPNCLTTLPRLLMSEHGILSSYRSATVSLSDTQPLPSYSRAAIVLEIHVGAFLVFAFLAPPQTGRFFSLQNTIFFSLRPYHRPCFEERCASSYKDMLLPPCLSSD